MKIITIIIIFCLLVLIVKDIMYYQEKPYVLPPLTVNSLRPYEPRHHFYPDTIYPKWFFGYYLDPVYQKQSYSLKQSEALCKMNCFNDYKHVTKYTQVTKDDVKKIKQCLAYCDS